MEGRFNGGFFALLDRGGGGDLYFVGLMKTLVIGNLFKPFRLAITFAREVYHLGIKMKTNMTIAFFSLSPTANCPYECDGKS